LWNGFTVSLKSLGAFLFKGKHMKLSTELQLSLIDRAHKEHGKISFCGTATCWEECFIKEDGELNFWFNDSGNNTHLITVPYEE